MGQILISEFNQQHFTMETQDIKLFDWENRKKFKIGKNTEADIKLSTKQLIKFTYKNLQNLLIKIYKENQNGFKIMIGFGFVLYNPTTGKYKYFYVGENNYLFNRAFTIDSIADINKFMKKIIAVDLKT